MAKNNSRRAVYNVSESGNYKRERRLKRVGMGIRRGDTRHGGVSNVVVWKGTDEESDTNRFVLTLSEARSLLSFLKKELQTLAR